MSMSDFAQGGGFELDAPSTSTAESTGAAAPETPASQGDGQPAVQPQVAPVGTQAPADPTAMPVQGQGETPAPRALTEADFARFQQAQAARQQQYEQQLRAAQADRARMERMVFEQRLQGLPQEQRQLLQAQWEIRQQQLQVQQAREQQQASLKALEPVFAEMVVRDLAEQYRPYGVTREQLKRFPSPEAMEAFCEWRKEQHREAQAKARAQAGTDTAASATAAQRPAPAKSDWRSRSLTEDLAAAFK
jgi:hypothetical protein